MRRYIIWDIYNTEEKLLIFSKVRYSDESTHLYARMLCVADRHQAIRGICSHAVLGAPATWHDIRRGHKLWEQHIYM